MLARLAIKSRVLAAISANRAALVSRYMPRQPLTPAQWQRAVRRYNR